MQAIQLGYTDFLAVRRMPWPERDGRRQTSFECMTRVAKTCDFVSLSYDFAQKFFSRQLFPLQRFPASRQLHEAPVVPGRFVSVACADATQTLLLRVRSSEVARISASLAIPSSFRHGVSE
jgi:hypothetical protein